MLKRKILKKISIIFACLIVIEVIILFPKTNEEFTIVNEKNMGTIYLLDDNNFVSKLDIIFDSVDKIDNIKEIIDILTVKNIANTKIKDGFFPVIPKNTKLLNFEIKDKNIILNFSKEFLNIDITTEEKMIEALIYSLTSLKDIDSISINIDGEKLECLPNSKKNLPNILDRGFKINKVYDLNSMNNIKETTIYYLAKKNDYMYYIPVTKYTNSDKEKIEIIIEELKSSTTYNTNMINYINTETKLMNHEILDKSFILNFNDTILTDINSNTITEEVKYAISLSVKDNYDIDEIMYCVNDNIIENYYLLLG